MSLTKVQEIVLIGTILGDGYLEKNGCHYRLQVLHSLKQKDYVDWKYKVFQQITKTQPRVIGQLKATYRFRTRTNPVFDKFHSLFYPNKVKIIPGAIKKLLVHPQSLAVWFMDDGKRRPDCGGFYLDTICFSVNDQKLLIEALESNFGLSQLKLHWNGDGYHIYIPAKNKDLFLSLVRKYIIPSMLYKLPLGSLR